MYVKVTQLNLLIHVKRALNDGMLLLSMVGKLSLGQAGKAAKWCCLPSSLINAHAHPNV